MNPTIAAISAATIPNAMSATLTCGPEHAVTLDRNNVANEYAAEEPDRKTHEHWMERMVRERRFSLA